MTSFLGSAFMSNQQFATSLNLIKSNLYTAFAPIYNAVLPAINDLMSKLATATAYIASFINQLFGSTYEAGFKSAQNLQNSIGAYEQQEKAAKKAATALGSAGSAAKKAGKDAKSGLMGFDEINKLSEKTPTPAGSGVVDPITPMANMAPIEAATSGWVQKFKDDLAKIFDPMKEAWSKEGKSTTDAFKEAFDNIWSLAKDIGSTFLKVWDNGTGVKVTTDILKLFQTMFGIVGDIAKAFKTAWDTGDLGEKVVQALFNSFDSILKLLNNIGTTFRDVWNNGTGVKTSTLLLQISKNIFDTVTGIANAFSTAWNSTVGKTLVQTIFNLLNNTLTVIKDIGDSFLQVWNNGIGVKVCTNILDILTNIVGTVSDLAGNFAKAWETGNIGTQIIQVISNTFNNLLILVSHIGESIRDTFNGQEVQGAINMFMQVINATIELLQNLSSKFVYVWDNGGSHLFEGIVKLGAEVLQIAGIIYNSFVAPFVSWFIDQIAPAVATVFDGLGDLLDLVISVAKFLTTTGKSAIETICTALKGTLEDFLRPIFEFLTDELNATQTILKGLIDFITGVFTLNWTQAFNGILEVFKGVFEALYGIAKAPINGVIGLLNGMINGINIAIKGLNKIKINVPDNKIFGSLAGTKLGFNIDPMDNIPYLATGGIIDSPTLAMVGEAGKEAVMPLENNTGWITELATKIAGIMGASSNSVSTSQQGGDIIFMIDGSVIGKVALNQLRKMQRQGNIQVIPV